MAKPWNIRFAMYARSQFRTPSAQLKRDHIRWPGGCMAGFILWIAARKQEFLDQHPEHCCILCNQDAWTKFLRQYAKQSCSKGKKKCR